MARATRSPAPTRTAPTRRGCSAGNAYNLAEQGGEEEGGEDCGLLAERRVGEDGVDEQGRDAAEEEQGGRRRREAGR